MSDSQDREIETLAAQVGNALKRREVMLVTAESCTGGWVAQVITAVPGSSQWYERGFITYSNTSKREMLGLSDTMMASFGAVSEQTVRDMAAAALERSHAQVSLAVSGIAGPAGALPDKPVGTVCLAWASSGKTMLSRVEHFSGGREAVRRQAVIAALQGVLDLLID